MKPIPPELEGEYLIRVVDMPEFMNGMVKYDENDFANVYVNARLNAEGRRKAADHELTHIINDDIHNSDPIEVIEARADGLPAPSKSLPRLMRARDLIPSWDRGRFLQPFSRSGGVHAATHPRGTGDGSSNHLSNSLPRLSQSLPLQSGIAHASRARDGKVDFPENACIVRGKTDEVVPPVPHSPVPHSPVPPSPVPPSPVPHSPVPSPPASLSPRQAAVLLHAVNDLDTLLFDPDHDMIDWR